MSKVDTARLATAIARTSRAPLTDSTSDMLGEALALARFGFSIFPCHGVWGPQNGILRCTCGNPRCGSPGKHPAIRQWQTEATRDLARINQFWIDRPNNNIGLATGGGALVLDVDPRNGGDNSLARLEAEHGQLPKTWRSKTGGGGEHIFFANPAGYQIANSAGGIAPGLDIKSKGGYVIAPPSRHASGGTYTWNADLHPDRTRLAPMPDWLVALCRKARDAGGDAGGVARSGDYWANLATSKVGEGHRNNTMASLTGHLIRNRVQPLLVLELAQLWNRAHCVPPLNEDEVVKILDSISGRELQRRGVS